MFSPVESQVIFLSEETPIVSVGLRTAEVSYTNQCYTPVLNDQSFHHWQSFVNQIGFHIKYVSAIIVFIQLHVYNSYLLLFDLERSNDF
jgi:hypothetical protein